jgi:hypothetical protein
MTRMIPFLAAGALLIGSSVALAQTSEKTTTNAQASGQANAGASVNQSGQSGSLAAGTAVNAQLSQTLDSKKAKPGDTVTAQTTDVVKTDGKVVIPKNTKLVGHVTRATARSKGDADSVLAVQFDRAVLKDGHEVPLQVTIQALAADQRAAAVNPDELQPAPNIEAGAAGAGAAGNRGAVGGVGGTAASTVGGAASGAASTVPRATQDATGAVNSTTGAAANAAGGAQGGLNASGNLIPSSRGVFGINGLSLNSNVANSTEGSLIISQGKNVRLDSGTKMLLVTQTSPSASAQPQP